MEARHSESYDSNPHETQQRQRDGCLWAMCIHLSMLLGTFVPVAGWVVPIILWQVMKDEYPELDAHGRTVANWMVAELVYFCVCILLIFVIVGIPLIVILGVISVVFPLIGGIKANNGEVWEYPGSFRIF